MVRLLSSAWTAKSHSCRSDDDGKVLLLLLLLMVMVTPAATVPLVVAALSLTTVVLAGRRMTRVVQRVATRHNSHREETKSMMGMRPEGREVTTAHERRIFFCR